MKSSLSSILLGSLAALFLATIAQANLESCGSDTDDFKTYGVDYVPVKTNQQLCLDMEGEWRRSMPSDAVISYGLTVTNPNLKAGWDAPAISSLGAATKDFPLRPCLWFPPEFQNLAAGTRVLIRVESLYNTQDKNEKGKRIFCVTGDISIGY